MEETTIARERSKYSINYQSVYFAPPRFFKNTGAVAAVFVLVGLAAASIVLFLFFYICRRRRRQISEHEVALAVASSTRTPLDDDEFGPASLPEMAHRSTMGSIPISTRTSTLFNDDPSGPNGTNGDFFNPYADFGHGHPVPMNSAVGGYIPARTCSPPPPPGTFNPLSPQSSETGNGTGHGHYASHSVSSYEPLLAAFYQAQNQTPLSDTGADTSAGGEMAAGRPPTPPPRNPRRSIDNKVPIVVAHEENGKANGEKSVGGKRRRSLESQYSTESSDDRLDPGLRQKLLDRKREARASEDLRDEEDYSRPVLGVRNLPDGASLMSRDS
ncbi:hypothetical protein L218DRAFT_12372 [Marasmius fiardii PR-910]|nr:hypothetical protein L218DRAFT_12372 [Marasmius fiardii PR-910]